MVISHDNVCRRPEDLLVACGSDCGVPVVGVLSHALGVLCLEIVLFSFCFCFSLFSFALFCFFCFQIVFFSIVFALLQPSSHHCCDATYYGWSRFLCLWCIVFVFPPPSSHHSREWRYMVWMKSIFMPLVHSAVFTP